MPIRASDARSWVECKRRAWFDHNPPPGMVDEVVQEFDALMMTAGLVHEENVRQTLSQEFEMVEATSPNHTQELMRSHIAAIYQGQFEQEDIIGKPDFLILHESGNYQAFDAKLARSADKKKDIKIQLGVYRKFLNNGLPAIVLLGDGSREEYGSEVDPLTIDFLDSMRELLASSLPAARYGETKCGECPYHDICKPEFQQRGELTMLYGISSLSAPSFEQQGISTIPQLAMTNPSQIADGRYLKGIEFKTRSVLQAKAVMEGRMQQLSTINLPSGTWVHFDVEDNPFTSSGQKHVYLWGLLKPPYALADYEYVWTDSESDDRRGWEDFLVKIEKYEQTHPDLVIAHYSDYERGTIKHYAKRYGMLDHPTVAWLLGLNSPLFDLQKPILESLVLPIAGYGLKQVCKHPELVNYQWNNEDSGSQWSVVQFAKFLEEQNIENKAAIKQNILTYNFDDVMATRMLELWLRQLPPVAIELTNIVS